MLLTPRFVRCSFIHCGISPFEDPLRQLICSSDRLLGPFSLPSFPPALPSFVQVRSVEPLPSFPRGHPPLSLPCHRQWAMWQLRSSAHYRPRWAHRGHGTVEHDLAFAASCQGFPFTEPGMLGFLSLYGWCHGQKPI